MEIVDLKAVSGETALKKAGEVLYSGGLVIYPTDTVYGVGVDATNAVAVDKLLSYKRQRDQKPISVAVSDQMMAEEYVELNQQARSLYRTMLPGPFTVVSVGKGKVDPRCESSQKTLGVRIPDSRLVLGMIKFFGKPVTATSANASFKKKPYTIDDVLSRLDEHQRALVGLVLDNGVLPPREPSTVIDTTIGGLQVLRQGDVVLTNEENFQTCSEVETIELGQKMMRRYQHYVGYRSVVFALRGEMGVGKTQFVKGVASQLGVTTALTSPTFILCQQYKIEVVPGSHAADLNPSLLHLDLWRMRDSGELEGLELGSFAQGGNVFAVEWADRMLDQLLEFLPDSVVVKVDIEYDPQIDRRNIRIRH